MGMWGTQSNSLGQEGRHFRGGGGQTGILRVLETRTGIVSLGRGGEKRVGKRRGGGRRWGHRTAGLNSQAPLLVSGGICACKYIRRQVHPTYLETCCVEGRKKQNKTSISRAGLFSVLAFCSAKRLRI